jgi:fructose-bisphosphate aldolase, class I
MDHAPSYGILPGLEDISNLLGRVVEAGPDAVLLMKGTASRCFSQYAGKTALIIKSSTISPHHPEHDVCVSAAEDAVRLGADAMAVAATIGSMHQAEILSGIAGLVKDAERLSMPLIVHAYPFGELIPSAERYTAARVGYAARLVMEMGVDIVKSPYTGSAQSFHEVVCMAAPALVVAAGGPRLDTEEDVLKMAHDVVKAGGAGITFGRNIWQSRNLPGLMRALKLVVHEEASVKAALKEINQG